jgi:ABC-type lipoprotein export system ATPase subunit
MICTLNNITKTYPSPSGNERITVLADVSVAVDRCSSIAITGPSGSGKTTLLHIAAAMDQPDAGTVSIDGYYLSIFKKDQLAALRNRKIGMVFQKHYLLPQLTLLENVLLPSLPFQTKANRAQSLERALYLIKRMGLEKRSHHFPSQLSGGECQRTALARALVNSPSLLCADEPTGSLDRTAAREIGALLKEINKEEQTALLVVTHSEELASTMNRVLELCDGTLKPLA